MGDEPPRGPEWSRIYAAAWLVYATLYVTALVAGGVTGPLAARNAVANVLPDAALGLLVLRVPSRVPWRDGKRNRFLAAHGALCALFLLATTLGWLALWGLDRGLFDGVWSVRFDLRLLPWRLLTGLLVYGTLAGFGYALEQGRARRELEARAARAEALRARAELEALRSQLDPHFILNTLHALVGLVHRDPERAEEALERLGDLLRQSLRRQREGSDLVPLREEWELVRGYLELERLRLGDRLQTDVDLAAASLEADLPSFALQTLVENAVRHGIAPRPSGGRLTIATRRLGDVLRVQVENDAPESATPGEAPGIGLRLLTERLTALYGAGARLATSAGAGRFEATLELPLRSEEEA